MWIWQLVDVDPAIVFVTSLHLWQVKSQNPILVVSGNLRTINIWETVLTAHLAVTPFTVQDVALLVTLIGEGVPVTGDGQNVVSIVDVDLSLIHI